MSVLAATLALALAAPAAPADKFPEVWMAILPADVLVEEGADWEFVKKHVDGCKFWTQQIDFPAQHWPFQGKVKAPGALEKLVDVLNANNIDIIIEKGAWPLLPKHASPVAEMMGGKAGPMDMSVAERAADNEINRLTRMRMMGAEVRFLDVDGPVRHLLYVAHPDESARGITNIEAAVDVFIEYMARIQKHFPNVEFFALTNFPNFGYKGEVAYWGTDGWCDYFDALEAIVRKCKAAGSPLRGITVDNPYDYALGEAPTPWSEDPKKIDWTARILDMEKYVREHGLEYNFIFNSQRGGGESAERFCKESLEFIEYYHAKGGRADRYIMQSWYTHPDRTMIVPEDKPYTFTWLVKETIKRVKGVEE